MYIQYNNSIINKKHITASRSLRAAALLLVAAFGFAPARAQEKNEKAPPPADLASQNLKQVAASASEIKAVLIGDPGLLVELKRWVAKTATDHGQVLGESDLSDYAIFDRLSSDVEFRSIATVLIQKYGYLIPKVNPNSELGKQQQLLLVERTKWLAQAEELERTQAQQKANEAFQKASSCERQSDRECIEPPARDARENSDRLRQLNAPAMENSPAEEGRPSAPPADSGTTLQRAQLMQTATGSSGTSSVALGAAGGDAATRALSAVMNGGNSTMGGSSDGLLSAFGAAAGSGPDLFNGSMPGSERADTGSKNEAGYSRLVPMQPSSRSPQRSTTQTPDMVRASNPYEDVPSLYDMYMRAVARPSTPKRFGMDIFENGTRDLQLIPMDLPAGPDYVVGPGDGLSIDLWGGVSQRLVRTVDRGGQITLPETGPLLVSGKTLAVVQQDVQKILRNQYRDVSAGVSLSHLRTIRIYEVGDVSEPGAYDISSLSTPLNALFVAGGPSARGSMRILKHYRGNQLVQTVDVYDLLLHGVKTNIEQLENGDTVQVPPIGPQVTVEGMVHRPAIYELRDEKSLASVIELAGGLLPAASLRHIEVQRLIAHEKETMLSLDISDSTDRAEVTRKLEAFQIQDGDRIRIFPIAPYNQDTIYVEGHVVRPGRYSYRPDMRVTDLVSSYKDTLPEPATQYAEIIRLNAPDFRPSVESFNLGDALADPSKAPLLHPMDTVRIFSKFDFENAPTIDVMGDVRNPGTYNTAGQVRLADAVHLAGGLSSDAQTIDAQVFRYLPDGRFKIFTVGLSEALAGDPMQNIVLESRDRLLIHTSPDAAQQATVYIKGEVVQPGRYPLTTNMRVADLIHIGGGLKPSADGQVADLTQYEWSNQKQLQGVDRQIAISAALARDPNADLSLHNGDVLTIRQLPGWNDLGAYITLKGEVKKPGVYGIRPGEKLSSILERAGGFQSDAYPYAAVLQREQVRDVEQKQQDTLIVRAKSVESAIDQMPENDEKQKQAKETALQQYRTTLEQLTANPPIGRVSMRITGEINRWKNTSADMEVRAGDSLVIPKKPSYVLVTGQVFNPTAVAYRPGKSAAWYLSQGGGVTALGSKKEVFVIRADGSVIAPRTSLWTGASFSSALQPGDTVVVPERAISGPRDWQTIFSAAQVASSVATSVFLVLHY